MTMTDSMLIKTILDVIAQRAHDATICSMSIREMVTKSGYSTSSVRIAINLLCAIGKVQKITHSEDGRKLRKNCYIIRY